MQQHQRVKKTYNPPPSRSHAHHHRASLKHMTHQHQNHIEIEPSDDEFIPPLRKPLAPPPRSISASPMTDTKKMEKPRQVWKAKRPGQNPTSPDSHHVDDERHEVEIEAHSRISMIHKSMLHNSHSTSQLEKNKIHHPNATTHNLHDNSKSKIQNRENVFNRLRQRSAGPMRSMKHKSTTTPTTTLERPKSRHFRHTKVPQNPQQQQQRLNDPEADGFFPIDESSNSPFTIQIITLATRDKWMTSEAPEELAEVVKPGENGFATFCTDLRKNSPCSEDEPEVDLEDLGWLQRSSKYKALSPDETPPGLGPETEDLEPVPEKLVQVDLMTSLGEEFLSLFSR